MDRGQEGHAFDGVVELKETDPGDPAEGAEVLAAATRPVAFAAVETVTHPGAAAFHPKPDQAAPTEPRAKAPRKPVGRHRRSAAARGAETPLEALARLRDEAEATIDRLIALLDQIEGDPDLEADIDTHEGDELDEGEPDLASIERISQATLNGDDREDDDDGEPSLAVPEVPQHCDQSRAWGAACRSRLRNEDLEFEGDTVDEYDREEEEDDDPGSDTQSNVRFLTTAQAAELFGKHRRKRDE